MHVLKQMQWMNQSRGSVLLGCSRVEGHEQTTALFDGNYRRCIVGQKGEVDRFGLKRGEK